jgi:hypothetical protein
MKGFTIALFVLLSVTLTCIAEDKPNKVDKKTAQLMYIDSRLEEAKNMCIAHVRDTALDPESLRIDEKFEHGKYGNGPWNKNGIGILLFGWAKNSYGAVLRHNFYCGMVCKPNEPCHVSTSNEDVSHSWLD